MHATQVPAPSQKAPPLVQGVSRAASLVEQTPAVHSATRQVVPVGGQSVAGFVHPPLDVVPLVGVDPELVLVPPCELEGEGDPLPAAPVPAPPSPESMRAPVAHPSATAIEDAAAKATERKRSIGRCYRAPPSDHKSRWRAGPSPVRHGWGPKVTQAMSFVPPSSWGSDQTRPSVERRTRVTSNATYVPWPKPAR